MDESTFIFRGFGIDFLFLFHFSIKIKIIANRIATDGTQRFAASQLGLFCLPDYSSFMTEKDHLAYVP